MAGLGGSKADAGRLRIPIIVIGGPTCSGKSTLAISLAGIFGAEIISADSRQIYRQLKIGTDRLDPEQWGGVPHHLTGTVDLGERYTVFDFVRQSSEIIHRVTASHRRVIVCGGTGLYIRALVDGIFEIPEEDMAYRTELLDIAATRGPRHLHDMLRNVDPESAKEIHPHNMVRVVRALEIYHMTGRRKSELAGQPAIQDERFEFLQLVLLPPRAELYKRIEDRVDQMVKDGIFEEAKSVYASSLGTALKESKVVGYAEIIRHFEEELSRPETIRLIKQNTRRFAKRQYTWFRAVKRGNQIVDFGPQALPAAEKLAQAFWC